ncbi:MAG: phage tail tube protein [Candidatus Humimicrobiaceae bacterium]
MGRTLTNNFGLQYAIEASIGVLPGTPIWKILEPNAISTFGATITTVERSPISAERQRKKGVITDLDSAVEFDADLTIEHFDDFIEGFVFSSFIGPEEMIPTATTISAYTIPTGTAHPQDTLVFARGWTNPENNGLKVVDTGSTTTSVPIEGAGLVVETPPATQNATLEVTGFRFALNDLEIDADGNLITTVKDFAELGLTPGQSIWVGGDVALNQFATADDKGFARVVVIETNKLTIDKTSQVFTIDDGDTKEIELYFGRFVRNVTVDDGDFLERSFTFEGAYDNLAEPGPGDAYEYAKGNFCNTFGWDLPLTDKSTFTASFVGTDTEPPTETRDPEGGNAIQVVQSSPFNTSTDIARLRIQEADETGLTTDFKSITLTLNNNVSPEKVLGLIGARYMNSGNFEIDMETQLVFTDPDVIAAIRNNDRVTMDFAVRNDDGVILIDIPSMTLGAGDREFPVNESILINITGQAYGDTTFGTSIGVSKFPYAPNF